MGLIIGWTKFDLVGKKNIFNLCTVLFLILLLLTSSIGFTLANGHNYKLNTITETDGDVYNKPRTPNADTEPNNDFNTASIVQYDPSGTTHVFDASVGGTDASDFWRLDCDRGTPTGSGSSNPDKIRIILNFNETNQGSNGVWMNIYDAEYHHLGSSTIAHELVPVMITLIAQVNPYFYIEVKSNPLFSNHNYILTITNETEPINNAFGDNEKFSNATTLNITKGGTLNGIEQYLDRSYDFADFYKFDAVKDQKIELNLQPSRLTLDDFDLYLFSSPQAGNWVASSEKIKQDEKIIYYSPSNAMYYLRVAVKNIADPNLENMGNYKLTFKGNLPPQWNTSFPIQNTMDEDGPDLIIPITQAYHEKNLGDNIYIEVFDPNSNTSGDWRDLDDFTSIGLQNLTIKTQGELIKQLRIKAKPNKFGTDTIRVRATDDLLENYTYQNIKIIIRPTNDAPILNGTNNWKISSGLIPSNKGDKITGQEGSLFECWVTAYEPYDPFDDITFSDNTDIFDIDPDTGKISFLARYHYTGEHKIKITVTDNGTPQLNTTREFIFLLESPGSYPEVELLKPNDESIIFTLYPQFTWKQINEDFEDEVINYELYLSQNIDHINKLDDSALIAELTETTIFTLNESLNDKTTYYWTVIPNDGIHLGKCVSGIYSFEVNTGIIKPTVELRSPLNEQILDTDTVVLEWDLTYSEKDKVSYDVYFGVSLEELTDPLQAPTATIDKNSYEIKNLYYERNYYWKVQPHTEKVKGPESEIFIFYLTKKVPKIDLLTPVNNTIMLPTDSIILTWDIIYTKSSEITCILFWGTEPTFNGANGVEVGNNESYILTDLGIGTYYWMVVPYLGSQLGLNSETWSFSFQEVNVPEVIINEPLNTTIYSDREELIYVHLSWKLEYKDNLDYNDLWYDIFLDNSTNDISQMDKLSIGRYRQSFHDLFLFFESNKTYYWYVIPHLETDAGSITGVCRSGVVYFKFGEIDKSYNISMKLTTETLEIEPGTQKIIHMLLKNLGNQPATVSIAANSDHPDLIIASLGTKKLLIQPNEEKNISLSILVLESAGNIRANITIKAVVDESTVVTAEDKISIKVVSDDIPPPPGNGDEDNIFGLNTTLGIIYIVLIIVIFLIISLFLYSKIKRHRLLENQRREAIFNHIKTKPGDHFRSIMNQLNLEVGTLSYHVNKLESEGLIKSRQDGMYRRFYMIDAKIDGKLILSELQERILNFIKTNPGITGSNIANEFGMDRKIITYHVGVLQKVGFVYTEASGREVLCYSTSGA